ncbi:putative LRR receptor-like serine/threonine-protein kinase [Apostasia shenzhenica]|uniref:Putative LRR receptor-like serine/threonine-protein kinase n=1 Tax=Apostasia shenzhenica TaxID=1088818 RepID=A0A2I0ACE1_9ASPA|nr:putative LRR receptor-like serine/threonine-protein kinase [Apostasia shenzhenica]
MDFKWCCYGSRKMEQDSLAELSSEKNVRLFTYKVLKSATESFHQSHKIGRGGFGTVYKGILRDGTPIAAKVLSAESRQGLNEFLTEIDVITNVKHPNLVQLFGCCVEGKNRILVYEYAENNSLDHALLGFNSERAKMDWGIRSQICIGIAKGLAYLHEGVEPPIVHRDIKASNILLDKTFFPKIGDFGLAKLFPDNITHISTRVAGTTGYLAPEYAVQGQLTKKADIYSFGVLVIEIISAKSVSRHNWLGTDRVLLEWIWELYEDGKLTDAVDPSLGNYPEEEVLRYIKVALFCTQAAAGRRPSMPEVLRMLSNPVRINENELTRPGFSQGSKGLEEASKTSFPSITTFPPSAASLTDIAPR